MVSSQTGSGKDRCLPAACSARRCCRKGPRPKPKNAPRSGAAWRSPAGRTGAQTPPSAGPDQFPGFKAARRLIVVPRANWPSRWRNDAIGLVQHCRGLRIAQHRGRHALPTADRQVAERRPRGWPRPVACWTCSARCRSSSTGCSSSWSTKPTACSTWASRMIWLKSTS